METLLYSEQLGSFQSFTDSMPRFYMDFNGRLFYIDTNGSIYEKSPGVSFSDNIYVRLMINKDFMYTKVFDNVELYSDNDIELSAEYNTSKQNGVILVGAFENRERTYISAIPRDNEETRLRDKYLESNYNIKGIDGNNFSIPYIKTKYRYSVI